VRLKLSQFLAELTDEELRDDLDKLKRQVGEEEALSAVKPRGNA